MSRLRGKVAVALLCVGLAVASGVVALAAASAVGAQVKNRLRGFDPAVQPVRLSASDTAPDAWLGGERRCLRRWFDDRRRDGVPPLTVGSFSVE